MSVESGEAVGGAERQGLSRTALFAMATATGIAVANNYYNQPLLGIIESDLGQLSLTGLIPTATQLGYALGLFFLLPLGDLVRRRGLIVWQFILLCGALAFAALAPSALMLVLASLLVGAGATVAQQIVPFAAALARPEKQGATVGAVMAGLLTGILASRTLAGFVGEQYGWRMMFWLGIPLALAAALAMFVALPNHAPVSKLGYGGGLRSLFSLWRRFPSLRTATYIQAALFGSFSAFWTILALYLQTPRFGLGADVAGLFGMVGVVGALAAPFAGRIADRRGPHLVILLGVSLAVGAWALFGLWGSLAALIAGVILLDLGAQGAMVSNQHVVYALDDQARSRLNTLFMTGMFLGGAAGSALATLAWTQGGWPYVSMLGAGLAALALVLKFVARRIDRKIK